MTPGDVAELLLAAGGLAGIATLIRVFYDRRQGIASTEQAARAEEREDRRDTIADRDGLLDTLLNEVHDLREREAENRRRIESLEESRRVLYDHIDALEQHIWQQLPPPPPPRPGG